MIFIILIQFINFNQKRIELKLNILSKKIHLQLIIHSIIQINIYKTEINQIINQFKIKIMEYYNIL